MSLSFSPSEFIAEGREWGFLCVVVSYCQFVDSPPPTSPPVFFFFSLCRSIFRFLEILGKKLEVLTDKTIVLCCPIDKVNCYLRYTTLALLSEQNFVLCCLIDPNKTKLTKQNYCPVLLDRSKQNKTNKTKLLSCVARSIQTKQN